MPGKVQYAHYCTDVNGYERWEDRLENKPVYVHRLLAISEHGFDFVSDRDVHHKNGVPWDNRPDNIEPLSKSEHRKKHRKITKEEVQKLHIEKGLDYSEIANELDLTRKYVHQKVREYGLAWDQRWRD